MTPIATVDVVGLGYIGLPTAAVLASAGLRVHGTDVSERTVAAVSAGRVPFVEPDLADVVADAVRSGALTASAEPVAADAFIIAVPTPFQGDHAPDLRHVEAATRAIAPVLRAGDLVVVESTVPPGTTQRVAEWIAEARPDLADAVLVAHCPERVLPGRIMAEIVGNDRLVGGLTPAAAERARDLYARFCRGQIAVTDARTAELAKLTENAYRDVNIAFANELSLIAHRLGVDVRELISLANRHPRVDILAPGPGVGGHCIAVDPWFIVDAAPDEARLIRSARAVNDAKPAWVADRVREAAGRDDVVIAALGLAYKPDVDDLRESPAVAVVAHLAAALPAARILVVEPHVEALPAALADLPNVALAPLEDAAAQADVVVALVAHAAFRGTTPDALGLTGRPVVDTCGVWS